MRRARIMTILLPVVPGVGLCFLGFPINDVFLCQALAILSFLAGA